MPTSPRLSAHTTAWFIRAELLAARGDDGAAVQAYQQALAGSDEHAYLLARLAAAYDRLGHRDHAERMLDRAMALEPASEMPWLTRGAIAARHRELERALAAYERAETLEPMSLEGPSAIAALLKERGHPERAAAVLERAAARNPKGSAAAARARLELALARNDGQAVAAAAADLAPLSRAASKALVQAAALLLAEERAGLALRLLDQVPQTGPYLALRLRAALAAGRLERAKRLLRESPPQQLGGPLRAAQAFLQTGQPARAVELCDSVLARGRDAGASLLRARAQAQLGDVTASAESLTAIPLKSPHAPEARATLSQTLTRGGMTALGREVEAAQ